MKKREIKSLKGMRSTKRYLNGIYNPIREWINWTKNYAPFIKTKSLNS